jgi:hypothetical protein
VAEQNKTRIMKKLSTLLIITLMASMSLMASKTDNSKSEEKIAPSAPAFISSISGKVVDHSTGESLAGVKVVLEGTQQETFTDFDGNFSFANVNVVEAKLNASYISYRQESITVDEISGNIRFTLKSAY